MKKPFTDRYEVRCGVCGHRWIILSWNYRLPEYLLAVWALGCKYEHFAIHVKKYFGGNKNG